MDVRSLVGLVMQLYALFFTIVIGFFSAFSFGQDVIRTSVSEEFIDGLHVKYIKNIAKHVNMDVEIIPMPFARRIKELRQGNLDLLVGLRHHSDEQDEVVYITPSYESLRHSFFINRKNRHKLQNFEDLRKLSIGVTRHAKYFEQFDNEPDLVMVSVSTLRQKIGLLMKERINTFIHFQESTEPMLTQMGLEKHIVLADYQPIEVSKYYVAMSLNSPLISKKHLFESVVRKAVANKEFATIRREHYAYLSTLKPVAENSVKMNPNSIIANQEKQAD